jgi:hypothetical protein
MHSEPHAFSYAYPRATKSKIVIQNPKDMKILAMAVFLCRI